MVENSHSDELEIFTLYNHPSDYPDDYVIRRYVIKKGTTEPIADKDIFFKSSTLMACYIKMIEERGLYFVREGEMGDHCVMGIFI